MSNPNQRYFRSQNGSIINFEHIARIPDVNNLDVSLYAPRTTITMWITLASGNVIEHLMFVEEVAEFVTLYERWLSER